MKRKKLVTAAISCLFLMAGPDVLMAQDGIFSQFFASSLYLNPAFAGTGAGSSRLSMNYRNHPFPDSQGLATLYGAFDARVPGLFGGVGLAVTTDNQGGLYSRNQIAGIYAFHLQVSGDFFINFGAQAGYYRQQIHWDRLEFTNPNQPPPDQTWEHTANFAGGILFYNEKIYGGVAAHHLNQPRESIFGDERLDMKYTAHIGLYLEPDARRGRYSRGVDYFISPNLVYQQQGPFRRANAGFYGGVESIMAGAWFRHGFQDPSSLVFLVGLRLGSYRIGYSYDHSLTGYSDAFHAAHEISMSFEFFSDRSRWRTRPFNCPDF